MAYKLMKRLIALGRQTEEELLNKCDVYYAAGRLTDEEYNELAALISGDE